MSVYIELWQLITAAGAVAVSAVMGFWAVAKVTGTQFQRQLDVRFAAQQEARKSNHDQLSRRLDAVDQEAKQWSRIERDMLKWQAEMPVQYVRREDYIRGQSTLEAKLDSLATRMENILLKTAAREGKHNAPD